MKARIAVVTPLFMPGKRGGGPIRTLTSMTTTAPDWADVRVFTSSRDLGSSADMVADVNVVTEHAGVSAVYAQTHRWRGCRALVRELRRLHPDVLYLNSYWSPVYSQMLVLLHRLRLLRARAVILAPRGELAPAALGHHKVRKRALAFVNRLFGTHRGVVWHAPDGLEARDIRTFVGASLDVVVRSDDTALNDYATPRPPIEEAPHPIRAVFLGRVVEHKGPVLAARAVMRHAGRITLDLFGPAEDDSYAQELRRLERASGGSVQWRGFLEPDSVRQTLADYDVMVLPTRSENFGHAIAEALSVSTPVLVTGPTPWNQLLQESGAGWATPRTVDAVAECLGALVMLDAAQWDQLHDRVAVAFDGWYESAVHRPHLFTILRDAGYVDGEESQ